MNNVCKNLSDFVQSIEKEVEIKRPIDSEKTEEEFNKLHSDLIKKFEDYVKDK